VSAKHPIVAVTGMAGAGLSTVRHAFKEVFKRLDIQPAVVHGDGFRRYTDRQFCALLNEAKGSGRNISWFGPDCNHFEELETFFKSYGETGSGVWREYAHNEEHARRLNTGSGEFTPWKPLPPGSDLMFYEGQHGGVMSKTWTRRRVEDRHFPPEIDRRVGKDGIDVAQHVDLLIGVVPAINLEWIQKIHRDCEKHYCTENESVDTILRRMNDYLHYIVPQFGLTDINIQRMPLVDTSNPFTARDVPNPDESFLVVHFRDRRKYNFVEILEKIPRSFMSRATTIVVPGGELKLLLEIVCAPLLLEMMEKRREA
jgi:phosphoribulokinase